ncbi:MULTISPECIES: isoleucine--tRNA ligase [Acidobacterium]|uniref:Isoleucine--tRNA ligase n=1 Tax=Acidobacterium capsulatum (strain ATCC 51196 / DSM 11244 / BCRC 80197 / JCM 7670 / NBRC 15755 / NCIMB 13165 / 161) TaxID=240015 RepID=C1F0Y9_ACIC5|nr:MULTISPECIES: isoleucine--tRNA ligase [Acidobacterium]ACO32207.1 isoleucine--tRNA ligase [Acidobacterium capsulatum ATCC 51196]HCT61973.1 isoleucine--tRNA ligase [Acidobacterium sp.]
MSSAPELKATLTLPQTDFPMKANLPQNEPLRLQAWQSSGLYEQIRAARAGRPRYVLHDGPPYANGPIHLGHALNKCLKDFIVKSKTMAGFDSPYVPGFDCHGLPIEIKVDEQLGRKKLSMPPAEFLSACRAYAQKYIDLQTSQFVRLGVFGRWDRPYSTMSREYEASILETFYQFFEQGFVYKGLKPVYWCIHDRTALADAEIEYEMHTSPSVYVRYTLTSAPESIDAALAGRTVHTIIWTTTPWTLPASLAVAFHPDFTYVALEQDGHVYIVAEALAAAVREACKLQSAVEIARFAGAKLERTTYQHPFLDRSILGVLADYVTTEQGTGAVHTAPAHGADDFHTGTRYQLDQTCNVDNEGRLRNGLPEYEGKTVFQANEPIIELLTARGVLMGRNDIYHSYPHCWRCHKPVIFRATEQWFINIDTPMQTAGGKPTVFRQRALEEIRNSIRWDPAWGEERIANMIATRPDWCISRQRVWGVPIAVFLCNKCHEPLQNPAVNRAIVDLFAKEGAEIWHQREAAGLLPAGTACACGSSDFRKENDILDVWFDSGASWKAVLDAEPGLESPADLYFEGGDQYRGWFHTSLLTSVGIGAQHASPYRMVGTAGWTLDEQGRAMSKSLNNGVDPVDIANRMGAEIVRLWVASVDFREDVRGSENLMQRVAENYRKLRNTFRFLLGNLHEFNPATDSVPEANLLPLDRYMLQRMRELTEKLRGWYDAFQFHRVYHDVIEFCVVDLSAVYLDVLKDRMYTFAPKSEARRSAQTVIYTIAHALARLVAPILSFTADEVWQYLPQVAGHLPSVHLAEFPTPEEIAVTADPALLADWSTLFAVREEAMKSLEEARKEKRIGKGLEARLRIEADASVFALLTKYSAGLKEFFNVSQVEIAARTAEGFTPEALPADGSKCNRCWNYRTDVTDFLTWQGVCGRCQDALQQMGYGVHA